MNQLVKYLMIIKHAESYRSQPIPQGLLDAMGEFVAAGFKSGALKDTAGLKPTKEGFRRRPFTTRGNSWTCTACTGRRSKRSARYAH